MEEASSLFSKTDRQIYEALIANPDQITYKSITRLAEDTGVSQPAVSRFVKTIGYDSYRDFRSDMTSWLAATSETTDTDNSSLPSYFRHLNTTLEAAEQVLTKEYMKELMTYLDQFNHIYATGQGKSYQPAALMEILMRKHETDCHALPMDYIGEVSSYMGKKDLLILFSVSGKSEIFRNLSHTSGKLMLVTANAAPDNRFDRIVHLPYTTRDPEASAMSPVLFDIFVEFLDQQYGERKTENLHH